MDDQGMRDMIDPLASQSETISCVDANATSAVKSDDRIVWLVPQHLFM